MLILYGTEYGFTEEIAQKLFDTVAGLGHQLQPRLLNAKNHTMLDFKQEQVALCLFSTTGDGWFGEGVQ